jgi:hypothetical protein
MIHDAETARAAAPVASPVARIKALGRIKR